MKEGSSSCATAMHCTPWLMMTADGHERRKEVLAGLAKLPSAEEIKAAAAAMSPHESAQSSNSKSANGQPVENDKDAAATLASLSQA